MTLTEPPPFVSVVMPIRNEGEFIARSLGSVLAQDYPHDRFEILVADGGSSDRTREIVASLVKEVPPLRLIDNPGGIVPTGFNAALRLARGSFILRVDGHTELASDYVRQCVTELERTGADNVGGRMIAEGKGPVGQAIVLATSSPFGVGGGRFHYSESEEWVDTVYLGAWRRSTFERIGLFDEEFVRNQDDEFNYRLRAEGGRILLSPKIRSRYRSRSSWATLWRQYWQYGFWKVRVLQKHPAQMRFRQFVPPAFVVGLLLALATARFSRVGLLAAVAVFVSYLGTLAWGTLRSASGESLAVVVRLPVAFVILHVSYGLGFVMGLVRFTGRWRNGGRRRPSTGTGRGSP